jgi:membrane-associated phospholipid phosphatase
LAALATGLTLVMPVKVRFPVALLGLLAIGGTGAAVIVLRWHYPTDALGGVAVGVGSVLVVVALLLLPRTIAGVTNSAHLGGVFRADPSRDPCYRDTPGLRAGVRVNQSPGDVTTFGGRRTNASLTPEADCG